MQPIDFFDSPDLNTPPAVALERIREQAPRFREWFRSTGTVEMFAARDLVTLPYPSRYGLWEAAPPAVPFVWFVNRMFVVQWREDSGLKTLVAEPSDYELGESTPYLATAIDAMPIPNDKAIEWFFTRHGTVLEHLAQMGIDPADVNYTSFDHLHTQDIRRTVGTTRPQSDIESTEPMFPNARMLCQTDELEHVVHAHPFQARFHQPDTYADIRRDNIELIDHDVLLGPGVALIRTPGHTLGNMTLVVNTPHGILCSSENGVAVDSWEPAASKSKRIRRWAHTQGMEVLMNFNTPEYASLQYNSMVKEKLIADPLPSNPALPFVFPSSELTTHRLAPGVRPTHFHGEVTWTAASDRVNV